MKIRTKVTLWYTMLFSVLLTVILGYLLTMGGKILLSGSENLLRSQTEQMLQEVDVEDGALELDDHFRDNSKGVSIAVFCNGRLAAGHIPSDFTEELTFSEGDLRKTGKYLVYDVIGEDGVIARGFLSLEGMQNSEWGILIAALAASPLLVAAAALGGLAITGRAFRPIEEIARTAAQIGSGRDLSRRLHLSDTGDEVSALGSAFNGMLDKLEAAFSAEKQFSSDVSHELRTPIAVIQSQCEYALSNPGEAETHHALLEIQTKTGEMAILVSQLLELSRGENGTEHIALEPVELSELVRSVAEELEPQAEKKNIALAVSAPDNIVVQGEETLLLRLLLNLTDNAIKYTPDGGHVQISVREMETDVILSVSDDGIGMSPEHLTRIFHRFYRVDSSRQRNGNSYGLGLALCKWIVEVHGANITVNSAPNQGSEFKVTFHSPRNVPTDEQA